MCVDINSIRLMYKCMNMFWSQSYKLAFLVKMRLFAVSRAVIPNYYSSKTEQLIHVGKPCVYIKKKEKKVSSKSGIQGNKSV